MRSAAIPLLLSLALLQGCDPSSVQSRQASLPILSAASAGDRRAPDFNLTEVGSGKAVRLSDYRGKVVLLDFWATWCGPCRMEIPHFVELQDKYRSKGLRIIGVSLDQQGERVVKPFMQQWGVNYDVVIDETGEINSAYGGIRSIPTTFLIGKDGTIREAFEGYRPREVFEQAIVRILAEG